MCRRLRVMGQGVACVSLVEVMKGEHNVDIQDELEGVSSTFANLAVAYNAYFVPAGPRSQSPNTCVGGNHPGMVRLNTIFHVHGLSESSIPSLLSSID